MMDEEGYRDLVEKYTELHADVRELNVLQHTLENKLTALEQVYRRIGHVEREMAQMRESMVELSHTVRFLGESVSGASESVKKTQEEYQALLRQRGVEEMARAQAEIVALREAAAKRTVKRMMKDYAAPLLALLTIAGLLGTFFNRLLIWVLDHVR